MSGLAVKLTQARHAKSFVKVKMMLKFIRTRMVRFVLVTAVFALLITAPLKPVVYAGECTTVGTHNCGG